MVLGCKILAHMVLECKRIHKPGLAFSAILRIFMELCRSKVQPTLPHGYFINGVANPGVIYLKIFVIRHKLQLFLNLQQFSSII